MDEEFLFASEIWHLYGLSLVNTDSSYSYITDLNIVEYD